MKNENINQSIGLVYGLETVFDAGHLLHFFSFFFLLSNSWRAQTYFIITHLHIFPHSNVQNLPLKCAVSSDDKLSFFYPPLIFSTQPIEHVTLLSGERIDNDSVQASVHFH